MIFNFELRRGPHIQGFSVLAKNAPLLGHIGITADPVVAVIADSDSIP
jgi:hypothetical protein